MMGATAAPSCAPADQRGVATVDVVTRDQVRGGVVVVCPVRLRDALEPWLADRGRTRDVTIISPATDAETTRTAIRRSADHQLRGDKPPVDSVVLIGDVPAFVRPTTTTRRFGSTATLVTDLPYADFNDDRRVDAAVGRWPVASKVQLTRLVEKILASDRSNDFGPWRSRLELVGGLGGFGSVTDSAIELATRSILTSRLPRDVRTGVLYASPGHAFFPKYNSFPAAVTGRFNRGSRFWVYAGHGFIDVLDRVPPQTGPPIIDARTAATRLDVPPGRQPIAMLLACYTGAHDATIDSLAGSMLVAPGGPVAVVAGTRVTMPYGNASLALNLIDAVYDHRDSTLGRAWVRSLNQLVRPISDANDRPPSEVAVDAIAGLLNPGGGLNAERLEHAMLYTLFGDPTMRLHPPLDASVAATFSPEHERIAITINSPIAGTADVFVDRPLPGDPDDGNRIELKSTRTPIAANSPTLVHIATEATEADPTLLRRLIIRAHVASPSQWATGSTTLNP